MDVIDRIVKGEPLGKAAIKTTVEGYLTGSVPKEEMTAFLRAVCAHGMSDRDATYLTEVMLESGKTLSFRRRQYPYADKHSTGGVADSTTLIIAPIVAAAGVPFLKMSGRKLGHTGGTIDKLESFYGLRTELTIPEAESVVERTGAAIIAQTKDLVPADKALYKLRDETDTVRSLPLIASSVVSKKLASGADVLVLDVKAGNGAFMKTVEEGEALAKLMVHILHSHGKKAAAVLSDMNSPLGDGVGGAMELVDAVEVLEGKEGRLRDLALLIAGKLITLAKGVAPEEGQREALGILTSGKALAKFREIITAQGGSLELLKRETRDRIFFAREAGVVTAQKDGYVAHVDCVKLGFLARDQENGGGYGMRVPFKVGSAVKAGDALVRLYGKTPTDEAMLRALSDCFVISDAPVEPDPLVYRIIE